MCAFLGLVGHYRRFIKGFACIVLPLNDYLTEEGASGKSEHVSLSGDALKAFEALKQVCMTAPLLAFANYTKPFLLETDVSKDRLWVGCPQKQADRGYHPVTYENKALTPHERTTTQPSLSFWH